MGLAISLHWEAVEAEGQGNWYLSFLDLSEKFHVGQAQLYNLEQLPDLRIFVDTSSVLLTLNTKPRACCCYYHGNLATYKMGSVGRVKDYCVVLSSNHCSCGIRSGLPSVLGNPMMCPWPSSQSTWGCIRVGLSFDGGL